jgi:teichuronic acid biosynthesis glycosyltransferase TuaG
MEEHQDLVSIITPAYNAEKLIGRTIESVLAQSYQNWELIVVDDYSKDSTRDVVKFHAENDSRIRLVTLGNNNGAPAAPRNIGIREASGEWIALLDSDDVWHPRKLELQLQAMQKHGIDFSCTQMSDFTDERKLSFPDPGDDVCVEYISFAKQRLRARIPTSSVVARKELFMKFSFNEDIRYKAVEDFHCWLRIHQAIDYSIKLKCPLLWYRKIQGQISGSKIYMLERVYMVHKEYPGGSTAKAAFFAILHALGGFYYRALRKGL